MKAYTAVEELSGEWSGNVFYADSNVQARRMAANDLNDGEFGGLRVNRAPVLDQYYGKAIPLEVMTDLGWWTECHECGKRINSDLYCEPEEHPRHYGKEPIGVFNGLGFCCEECQVEWDRKRCQEPTIKYHTEQSLKALAEKYVTEPIFDGKFHCWINWHGVDPKVSSASLSFRVPGADQYNTMEVRQQTDMDGTVNTTLMLPLPDKREPYRIHATKALDILFDSA